MSTSERSPLGPSTEREMPSPYELGEYVAAAVGGVMRLADTRQGLFLMWVGVAIVVYGLASKIHIIAGVIGSLAADEFIAVMAIGGIMLLSGALLQAPTLRIRAKAAEAGRDVAAMVLSGRPATAANGRERAS